MFKMTRKNMFVKKKKKTQLTCETASQSAKTEKQLMRVKGQKKKKIIRKWSQKNSLKTHATFET